MRAVAKEAIRRNTGARGLRGVIESSMLDIMFEIPSKNNVKECIITAGVIDGSEKPKLIYGTKKDEAVNSSDESGEANTSEIA